MPSIKISALTEKATMAGTEEVLINDSGTSKKFSTQRFLDIKTASETAKTAAETAETNAETAETNASGSATSASGSATTATAQAVIATTKAGEASTSATSASGSAATATTQATSATSSATSATASATTATTQATTATTQAGIATTKAATATTKASEASTSATNAAASATTATTKAATATTQATAASGSATSASSSASSATTAQSAAEAARDSALAAFDSFDDRYLGQKSSAPTLDNDGNALVAGTLYFNTTSDAMFVYEGSAWVAAYASLSGALLQTNNLSDLNSAGTARTNLGLAALATLGSVAAGQIDANSVGASELNVSGNGTSGQYLGSDADGTFTWTSISADPTMGGDLSGTASNAQLGSNVVTDTELNSAKLNGIESGADVTDATNVSSAGALMKTGGTLTGNLSLGDNVKAQFGAGSDLQIWHDGSNSYIKDHDAGNLFIQGSTTVTIEDTGGNNMAVFNDGGSVDLYHGATKRFETTSTGIDVTGSVVVSGTVDGRDVAADGTKLDGIATSANNYSLPSSVVHDTEKGSLHATDALRLSGHTVSLYKGDGTSESVTIPDNNTTYSVGDNGLTQKNFTTTLWNKLDAIATSANNYSHPTHAGDDFSVDTGALSGATVVSDIDINVTTDSSGHVTDANGTVSTRTLTLANLGYTGATNANYITNNNQLTNGAGYTTNTGDITNVSTSGAIDGGGSSGSVTISHSTSAGNKHVATGGTVGQVLTNTASGTGTWQDAASGGDELIGVYTSSTTVSLAAGTYLLVAAGGGGGSHYNSSAGNGGASTVVLGDIKAYGYGGRKGVSNHHTGGSAGGRGGKGHVAAEDVVGGFYARTPVIINQKTGGHGCPGNYGAGGGWSMTDVTKTITTTTTATITVGAGGSTGGNQSYASTGESGFCTIWKIGA